MTLVDLIINLTTLGVLILDTDLRECLGIADSWAAFHARIGSR